MGPSPRGDGGVTVADVAAAAGMLAVSLAAVSLAATPMGLPSLSGPGAAVAVEIVPDPASLEVLSPASILSHARGGADEGGG